MKKILCLVALAAALTGCDDSADNYVWDATKEKATAICAEFGGKIEYMAFTGSSQKKWAFNAHCINPNTGNKFSVGFPGVPKESK